MLWEYKIVQPCWKSSGEFLKIVSIDPPNDPIILFLGTHSRKENMSAERTYVRMLIATLFIKSPKLETAQVSINRSMHKQMMDHNSAMRMNELLVYIIALMDLKNIVEGKKPHTKEHIPTDPFI